MIAYYFPELPLDVLKLSSLDKHPEYLDDAHTSSKFADWKHTYGEDILDSIKEKGQLDPNIGTWSGDAWVVEPGQSRWLALFKLGKKTQKVLVKVEEGNENNFKLLSKYEHTEVESIDAAKAFFKNTTEESHTGIGYLIRRGWFK
jgi:hypothetical protein